MSVDLSVYLGPYLEVPNERKLVRKDRCGHDVASGISFCPVCGQDQSNRYYDTAGSTKFDDMLRDAFEDFGEQLVRSIRDDDVEWMVPNVPFGLDRKCHFDPKYEQAAHTVKPSDQLREEIAFNEAFAEEIAKIKELQPDAHVKWGMVMWMS